MRSPRLCLLLCLGVISLSVGVLLLLLPGRSGLLLALGSEPSVPLDPPQAESEVPLEDLLGRLHLPPSAVARPVEDDVPVYRIGTHMAVSVAPPASVLLTGSIALARGPEGHGLESLACLAGGRMHESLIGLDSGDAALVKTACLAAFGFHDGESAGEGDDLPVRGAPLRVEVRWSDDEGRHWIVDASCLVRDRVTDRALPALPYVWTGSRMGRISEPDGRGGTRETPAFLLALDRVAVANENTLNALIASILPPSHDLMRWEVNTALAPHLDQPVALVLSRAELPLNLRLLPDGELALADGIRLDAGALGVHLASAFLPPSPQRLHAVRVRVAADVPRRYDVAARRALLAAAARVGVWCLPVFETDGIDPGPDPLLTHVQASPCASSR